MDIEIDRLQKKYFKPLHEVFRTVAAERKYLAWVTAPNQEESLEYYQNLVDQEAIAFVALEKGKVVGSCDVLPFRGDACKHVGHIGIFLTASNRYRGIGTRLMKVTIEKARNSGLTRIELTVRTDNLPAIALYKRLNFEIERTLRKKFLIEGSHHDVFAMALFP